MPTEKGKNSSLAVDGSFAEARRKRLPLQGLRARPSGFALAASQGAGPRKSGSSAKEPVSPLAGHFMVVSRAEHKLENAAQAFHFDFRGKTVLDIGSSTGGFTEYALSRGAARVIAVEKGTRQMKAPLRFDSRIELHEKTDIFNFETNEKIDVVLADVSFVSLTKVLAYAKMRLARRDTDFLVMLKPQFEAEAKQMVRGVVKNEKMRREVIRKFERWLVKNGFLVRGKRDNTLAGKNGNLERFYYLTLAK